MSHRGARYPGEVEPDYTLKGGVVVVVEGGKGYATGASHHDSPFPESSSSS